MKKIAFSAVVLALTCLCLRSLWSVESYRTLNQVKVDGSSIVMTLSGPAKYHAFKISNPSRIVIEFANTEFNAPQKETVVNGPVLLRVRSGQFKNEPSKVARVVVDLAAPSEYQLTGSGKDVTLKLGPVPQASSVPAAVAAKEPVVEVVKAPAAPAVPVTVKAPAPAPADETTTIEAKPADAVEEVFSTPPIPSVQAAAIKAEAPKPAEQPVPVIAAPKPAPAAAVAAAPAAAPAKPAEPVHLVLPTKPITIDFEDADIRDVLRILSMKSGINIIYGPDVTGNVTLRLDNVPFDKAFNTILSLKGLVSQEEDRNILRIVTPLKIAEERSQAVTFTKVFPLNYAKAEEIKSNLDSIRNAEGRRGNISVDARTNSLIVTDTPEGLVSLERIVQELDKRPAQVIIEAKIVEVVLNNSLDLGIQWQYANTLVNEPNQKLFIGATKSETSDSAMGSGASAGGTVISPLSTSEGGTGLTFPAAAVSGQIGQIAFGLISNETRITGILNALAQKGLSKLLSSPKVTTINNKEAKILVGQRIPYTTTTVTNSGATQQTNFLDVGIKLTVTPTINIDQKITLQVHPEVSLFIRADPAGPVIGTREALTTVIVSNGETVVIGGLITDDDRKLGTQVPLLGDLPIIGHLFRRDYKTKDRTELLVFITPQIIS